MNELILAYLNRFYTIRDGKFVHIESGRNEYGQKIVDKLNLIFSVGDDVCHNQLKDWSLELGMIQSQFTKNLYHEGYQGHLNHANGYEPKRANRFLITFPKHFNLQQWTICEASRPSMCVETKKFLGFTYYKKIKWNPIRIKLRDPIEPSISQSLIILIREQLEKPFSFKLEMLDPTGVAVENWVFDKTTIKSIDFGGLSLDNHDILTCEMVVNINDVIKNF